MLRKLQQMVAKGKILPEYLISEDKVLWVKAAEIKELFPELANIADDTLKNSGKDIISEIPVIIDDPSKADKELSIVKDTQQTEVTTVCKEEKEVVLENSRSDNIPHNRDESCNVILLSLLWNPVYALPVLFEQYSDARVKGSSFLFGLFAFLCFSATLFITFETSGDSGAILNFILLALLPFLLLSSFTAAFVTLFSKPESHGNSVLSRSLFLAGAALIPFSLSSLFSALLYMTKFFSPVQMIVIICGLGIYSFSYAVLLLFNGFTKVFGVKGGGTVFLVSSLLLLTSGITAFFIRLIQS